MNRHTSRIAYKNIIEEGKADSQQSYIIRLLKHEAPLSRREISKATNIEIGSVSGRVNELKKEGRLKEDPKRKCNITGRLVTPVRTLTMQEIISKI